MNRLIAIILLFLPLSSFASVEKPILRKVIALYDRNLNKDPFFTTIHQQVEMPLNYLGLEVQYHAIQDPLPSTDEMKDVRGIITWFEKYNVINNPDLYCPWLEAQMVQGKKVVIFEEPGFLMGNERKMPASCQKAFQKLGVEYLKEFSNNPFFFEITHKDSSMIEYERKLSLAENLLYSHYRVTDPQARVYLKVRRKDLADSESDLVFTNPQGGFVHSSYVIFEMKDIEKKQWRLNPFKFLEEAFDTTGFPKPDANTLNGKRIFYSHIDGDGIFNISAIDRKSFSGEIILKEILQKYPQVPITASLITGYFDMLEYKNQRTKDLYKNIYSLPNIEAASHGYAHPLVWRKGKVALTIPGYQFDAKKEIVDSTQLMNDLLKSLGIQKQTRLFQWTGDCFPSEDQVALSEQFKLINMNRGNSQFDQATDSYSFVYPIGLLRNQSRQIYAVAPNENIYTNLWEGPYYGFRRVLETFQSTEHPLRVKPINIYYHFYTGERLAAIEVLKQVYDIVLKQDIFPVFAAEYVEIAQDFFNTRIDADQGAWVIQNNGKLKTIRMDHNSKFVDLKRSLGILGFKHFQGNLYIHLAEGPGPFKIFLSAAPPQQPYLESSSFKLTQWQASPQLIQFEKSGWYRSEITLGGLFPLKKYRIETENEVINGTSNQLGKLDIRFKNAENSNLKHKVKISLESF